MILARTLLPLLLAFGLAAAAPAPDAESPLPLAELPPQVLPAGTCALFLWDRATRRRVLMATTSPSRIRIVHAGSMAVLDATSAEGETVFGFAPRARYKGPGFEIGLDLAIVANDAGGAVIRDGSITFTAADGGAVVAPVAGLVGCS